MKKIFIYIIVLLVGAGVFLLQFGYTKKYQPISVYQVYLDNEKIGVINSKEELEKYVDSQGELIKKQVSDYSVKTERIDTVRKIMKKVIKRKSSFYDTYSKMLSIESIYDKLSNYVDNEGNFKEDNYQNVNTIFNMISDKYKNNV